MVEQEMERTTRPGDIMAMQKSGIDSSARSSEGEEKYGLSMLTRRCDLLGTFQCLTYLFTLKLDESIIRSCRDDRCSRDR